MAKRLATLTVDRFGRVWDLPRSERCSVCDQPDNCGDCNHVQLSAEEAAQLGALGVIDLPATITVATVLQRPGSEGAEYVIRLPDGREASIYDGDERYWNIANAIDDTFPVPS